MKPATPLPPDFSRGKGGKRGAQLDKKSSRPALLGNRDVIHGIKKIRSKSVGPGSTFEDSQSSNTSQASAPSVTRSAVTANEGGQCYQCGCHCHMPDITQKSQAVICSIQEFCEELCNRQANAQSCMDWQPSTTTYILREKLVAGTATLKPASNP